MPPAYGFFIHDLKIDTLVCFSYTKCLLININGIYYLRDNNSTNHTYLNGDLVYSNEFVFGILGIVLGAVVLYKVEIVISLIPFILGVLVLCSGCSKLQDAIDLKRLDYGSWLGLLIVAAINIILGVVLIYNPFKAAIHNVPPACSFVSVNFDP